MDSGTASYGILPDNVRSLKPAEQVPNKVDINALFAAFQQLSDQIGNLRADQVAEFGFAGDRDDQMMAELKACREELSEARKVIEKVASEVMPAINELVNGPIGSILGMKKQVKR